MPAKTSVSPRSSPTSPAAESEEKWMFSQAIKVWDKIKGEKVT